MEDDEGVDEEDEFGSSFVMVEVEAAGRKLNVFCTFFFGPTFSIFYVFTFST